MEKSDAGMNTTAINFFLSTVQKMLHFKKTHFQTKTEKQFKIPGEDIQCSAEIFSRLIFFVGHTAFRYSATL